MYRVVEETVVVEGVKRGLGYRYGFNGMERDDNVKGAGNSYTTEFRQYDPRVARWLSIDPKSKKFPWQSPYVAFDNNPILFPDPTGEEIVNPYEGAKDNAEKISELTDEIATSTNKKQIRKLNNEIYRLTEELNKYNTVELLKSKFRSAVGEEEYNRIDNLTFNEETIDVIVYLEDAKPLKTNKNIPEEVDEDGITDMNFILERQTVIDHSSKEQYSRVVVKSINNNQIIIRLYVHKLSSFANEIGDSDYGVSYPQNVYEDRSKPYFEQRTTLYSFDYERYVTGSRKKPDASDY